MSADPCKSVFLTLAEADPDARRAELDRLARTDPALHARVAALLTAHDRASTPLDAPPSWTWTSAEPTSNAPDADADLDAPLHPGDRLGPYTIESTLGSGAMGVVFAARHAGTRRLVALKLIRPDASSPAARRRFETEGRALARLRHPGIAQVHDAGVAHCRGQPLPYLAMELVEGRPITDAARDLPRPDRVRLIERIARAVHHAHLNGVVHRDLKPANILIDANADPKVLDFGVAKLAAADTPAMTTHAGQLIGTPAYMSPEQLGADPDGGGGGGGVDHRVDVYALGALLFELLAGRRPIEAEPGEDLWCVLRRVEQGPPALASVDPASRGDLSVIAATALRKDPAERYQSAAELADDLARHLANEPIHARPRTRRYVMGRFLKRHPVPVSLGAAAALAVMAGTAGITIKQRQAAAAEARAIQRFDETRQLARAVLFELEDAIARLPGATRARHLLIATAQTYLDGLASDPSADDELRLEIAEGYTKLAEILGTPYMHNIGDRDGALRNIDAAFGLLEPMARPDAPARVRVALGRVLLLRSSTTPGDERDGGLADAVRAVELLGLASAMQPNDPSIETQHIRALRTRSMVGRLDDGQAGIDRLLSALDASRRALARWPLHEPLAQEYAELCYWIGLTLIEAGREGATEYLAEGERTINDLLDRDPTNVLARQRLASIWSIQARIAAAQGDAARTEATTRAVFDIWDHLAATDPDSQFISRGRFVSRVQAGDQFAALSQSDPDRMLEHYQAANRHFTEAGALLQTHIDRGWLWPWESLYPEIVRVRIEATATTIQRLEEAATPEKESAAAP